MAPLPTSNAAYLDLYNQLVHGLKSNFSFTIVRTYKVTYSIPGYSQPLTGLVAVPMDLNPLNRLSLPMISLQHPTQVLRSQSPSKVSVFEDEELTVPYGTMLAAMGYIVVMADYPGMGDNYDIHPYCMATLAKSVTGLIERRPDGNQAWSSRAVWNGKLFLIGFSEGLRQRRYSQGHPAESSGV